MIQNIIVVLFILGYLFFIYKTRKGNNYNNYAVAGRSVGILLLFLSMSALFTGPGWTLGLAQQGYSTGYFALFVASFYGLGKIIEGNLIAPKLRAKFKNSFSIGEVVGGKESHNKKIVQLTTGLISFGLLIGFSTIMSKSGGEILNSFLGIDKFIGVIIITGIVTSYSVFGGLKSSMLTDAFQFILIAVLIITLLVTLIFNTDYSFQSFYDNALSKTLAEFKNQNTFNMIGLGITWLLGEMMVPPTVNGILSSKNSNTAKRAITFSGITMILWLFIMLTIGLLALPSLSLTTNSDQVLLEISKLFLNPIVYTLFSLALIGVVMSTQDSLINSASITFGKDILSPFNLNIKQTYLYSRFVCVFVGVLSIVFSTYIPNIISSLLLFYSIWIPSMLVPLIFSVYKKNLNWQSAITSMISGIITGLIWSRFDITEYTPSIIGGLSVSLLAYILTDLIVNYKKETVTCPDIGLHK
ncbi:MAG: sodium:solute symporter family protein [Bacteroidetes bacterium]|nr:sodium:solute symporter family protein [Bacteroidota bacterium]